MHCPEGLWERRSKAAGHLQGTPVPRAPCLCHVSLVPSSSGLWPHLTVQGTDLLLVCRGQEEAAHLPLEWLFHLHVDVIARSLLLV